MILNTKNCSYSDYTNRRTPLANNDLFAAIAGTLWFLQFFFYGMGRSKLTNGASSWTLHMASFLTSNMWGISLGEWRGVSGRTLRRHLLGIATILASVAIVGDGNSLLAS